MGNKLEVIMSIKDMGTKALDKIQGKIKIFTDNIKKHFNKLSTIMSAGILAGTVNKFTDLFLTQERALKRFAIAVENTGQSYEAIRENVLATTAALQQKTNYGDEKQIAALSKLIPMVGSYEKAIEELPALLDFAAYSQTDVESAARQFGQALQGNVDILGRYFLDLREMKKEGASATEIMDKFKEKIKGFAEADVDPIVQFKNEMGDLGESVGKKIMPIINNLLKAFRALPTAIKTLLIVLPTLVTAIVALGGPVTAAIAGFGLLTTGILTITQKFRDAKQEVIDFKNALNEADAKAKGITEWKAPAITTGSKAMDLSGVSKEQLDNMLKYAVGKTEEEKNKLIELWNKAHNVKKELTNEELEIKIKAMEKEVEASEKLTNDINSWNDEQLNHKLNNLEAGLNLTRAFTEAEMEEQEKLRVKTRNRFYELVDLSQALGASMVAGVGKGAEGFKESLKAVLTTILSFIEKELIAAEVAAAIESVMTWNPLPLMKIFSLTAMFEAAKIGIQSFAKGTPYAPGGWSIVGEQGPEAMYVPRGSQIYNNNQTKQMLGGNTYNISLTGGATKQDARMIVDALVKAERDGYANKLKLALA